LLEFYDHFGACAVAADDERIAELVRAADEVLTRSGAVSPESEITETET
jgi:UDP-N-acetylglucosamine:LPS N-acetylglucosamine transferase